jgi:outer membrane protein
MTMKKYIFSLLAVFALITPKIYAQKTAYVDLDYILTNIPEYKSAQEQLDQISLGWQKEIEGKLAIVDRLYKSFQAEEILLTQDMKKKREDEIVAKEKEAKELQKQRFGVDGDLYKKRQELVKPIQDKVYNAIKELAEKQTIAIMFNKSAELNILFANPKFDKSDEVLEAMGYKPLGSSKDKDKGKK